MAASLGDLFDGAATADTTSAEQDLPGGVFTLFWSGTLDGPRVIIEAKDATLGTDWKSVDSNLNLSASSPGFINFSLAPCKIRARLEGVGHRSTANVKVGIVPIA